MGDLPPDWAAQRALDEAGCAWSIATWRAWLADKQGNVLAHSILAFARYIAGKEEPPVDKVDTILLEALHAFSPNDLKIYGDRKGVRIFRESLVRRGIEIAEARHD